MTSSTPSASGGNDAPLSLNERTLQLGGTRGWVDITDPELSLLRAFVSAASQRLDTARMLDLVGKSADKGAKRALEVQIVRLRRKLAEAGAPAPTIKSIRRTGYQLCVPIRIDSLLR